MSEKKESAQVLYMPAISLIVPNGQQYEHGSITYTYTPSNPHKASILSRILNAMISAVTFVIMVFLFSIPVTLASLILLTSSISPTDIATQNQDVPGISKVVPYERNQSSSIEPAH